VRLAFVFSVATVAALWMAAASSASAQRFDLPEGPGRELVYGHCQTCHDLQSVVDSAGIRRGAWDAFLDNMKDYGLRVSDDQRARILDYLGTYLGPNPPSPEAATSMAEAGAADGLKVFQDTCIACHQEDGMGKPGEFPPLAANPDLFLSSDFVAVVALNGIEGPLEVEGQSLDKAMPPFDFLTDQEIAAVVDYVRSTWGNDALRQPDFAGVTADDVAALRAKPMTAAEVHAYRQSLK
jgi:mono/diheme cytochrome c family protein